MTPWEPEDYDDGGPWVCLTHQRFMPCRRKDGCWSSNRPEDVERIRNYQLGWEI